jgi:hypothetical protein
MGMEEMPMRLTGLATILLVTGLGRHVHAQGNVTIQLPSFQQFSINTTISVPDRGGIYAGGASQSWHGSGRRGFPNLPGRRNSVRGASVSGVSVHAYVHPLDELDEATLQAWNHKKTVPSPNRVTSSSFPTVSRGTRPTIREQRAQIVAAEKAEQALAVADFQSGWRLEQLGKTGIAKIYYGMALKRAAGELRVKISSRLVALQSTQIARRP